MSGWDPHGGADGSPDFGDASGAARQRGPFDAAPGGSRQGGTDAPADSAPASDGLDAYRTDGGAPDPYAPQETAPNPYGSTLRTEGPDAKQVAPKQPKTTFWTGMLVGAVTLLVLTVIGLSILFDYYYGAPEHRIVRAPVAGGMKLDKEGVRVYSRAFDPYRQLLEDITGDRVGAANVVTGVYDAGRDSKTGQRRQILFLGSEGDLGNPHKVAAEYRDFEKRRNNLTVTRIDPGPRGGEAFCMELRFAEGAKQTVAGCVWLTESSLGYVIPTVPMKAAQVADIMRKMRPDLEVPE